MFRRKSLEVISNKPSAAVEAVRKPEASKGKIFLSSLPTELQLGIVHHLPRTSLPSICQLNKHWRRVGREELLRRLLPFPPYEDAIRLCEEKDLRRVIRHFIDTNNADALQHLLDFRPKHPYFRTPTTSLLTAEPASLRARVTEDEEERFCYGGHFSTTFSTKAAVKAAFKYNDMSCMQLLIDHGLADYSRLLDKAVDDGFCDGRHPGGWSGGWFARPLPRLDSWGDRNSVLNWLLAYPPHHVVQAMLVMWGTLSLHPRLLPLCDWCGWRSRDWGSRDRTRSCDNMLIVAAGRGHPASLQVINELRMMLEILTDKASGDIIPEARQPLSHALRIARGMASMWPGTPPLVAEFLQSICTWEDHQSSSSGARRSNNNPNNPPPQTVPPLILPPQYPILHRLIDLKTYDEMLEAENWLDLQREGQDCQLLWLVSTEFLADEEAARRMRCFKWLLRGLHSPRGSWYKVLNAAAAFRRWRCVEVVLGEMRRMCPGDLRYSRGPDMVLCRAILDAVHGEPGCANGRIIRKLLRAGTRDFKGFRVYEDMPNGNPFRGGWFGWEPFRLAFVEREQGREQRETAESTEMRDAVLDCLSICDHNALNYLVDEPSKALYRASARRRLQRWAERREKVKDAGRESSCRDSSYGSATSSSSSSSGESSCGSANSGSTSNSGGYAK